MLRTTGRKEAYYRNTVTSGLSLYSRVWQWFPSQSPVHTHTPLRHNPLFKHAGEQTSEKVNKANINSSLELSHKAWKNLQMQNTPYNGWVKSLFWPKKSYTYTEETWPIMPRKFASSWLGYGGMHVNYRHCYIKNNTEAVVLIYEQGIIVLRQGM